MVRGNLPERAGSTPGDLPGSKGSLPSAYEVLDEACKRGEHTVAEKVDAITQTRGIELNYHGPAICFNFNVVFLISG